MASNRKDRSSGGLRNVGADETESSHSGKSHAATSGSQSMSMKNGYAEKLSPAALAARKAAQQPAAKPWLPREVLAIVYLVVLIIAGSAAWDILSKRKHA